MKKVDSRDYKEIIMKVIWNAYSQTTGRKYYQDYDNPIFLKTAQGGGKKLTVPLPNDDEEIPNAQDDVDKNTTMKKSFTKRERKTKGNVPGSDPGNVQIAPNNEDVSVRMKIKPPAIDSRVPWSTYHKHFETAALANKWTRDKKATSLIVVLRYKPLNVLQTDFDNQQSVYEPI
ncbi:hypothetical protein FQR65_LT02808 [Abscondita terminalis]|nr:hypothetical protein FQR65_LT02808 [Abscondita terminalis]